MSELQRLIKDLQRNIKKNTSLVKSIAYPELLIESLTELSELIGNDKVKDAVATQVSHLLIVRERSQNNSGIKEDEVMLNTAMYGPPGVGKTLIGTKLGKIWYSLGFIKGAKKARHKATESESQLSDLLRDILQENGGGTDIDNSTIILYGMIILIGLFLLAIAFIQNIYLTLGTYIAIVVAIAIFILTMIVLYIIYMELNGSSSSSDKPAKPEERKVESVNKARVRDEDITTIVTRADFIDKYVGWTDKKTLKLLTANLGKVLIVDEAYSLINGPHDQFGMEALTTLNLFMSQHPQEIAVIFLGYRDLLETGVFSVQPGLKRRFMWQFDCPGYTGPELFSIFELQLAKKGWGLSQPEECYQLFLKNVDAFPAYGGDTERCGFFAELEHSRDYIRRKHKDMAINMLLTDHVSKGIQRLRENNISNSSKPAQESINPLAQIMRHLQSENSSMYNLPQAFT